jgi:hypothetical protein
MSIFILLALIKQETVLECPVDNENDSDFEVIQAATGLFRTQLES